MSEVLEAPSAETRHLARIKAKMRRELGRLYPLLQEDGVQEIFVNCDGNVFVDRAGGLREHAGSMRAIDVESFLASVASSLGTSITKDQPTIDGMLILDGSRVSGELPPVVRAPSLRIRKHAQAVLPLSQFVPDVMSEAQLEFLRSSIDARHNLVIVGGTASGKTFLAKSMLHELADRCPEDRILTIEDTPELIVSSKNALSWYVTEQVPMQRMLHRALRATPDRIVVGEVRGGEAYQLLKMWNTGHSGGLATLHSDQGALDGIHRLERMCGESEEARGMGTHWIAELVGATVDILINIVNIGGRRRINHIVEIDDYDRDSGKYRYQQLFNDKL